jgi:hypothetical protein
LDWLKQHKHTTINHYWNWFICTNHCAHDLQ